LALLLRGFVRWEGEHACCVFTGLVGPMSPDDNSYSFGFNSMHSSCLCSIEWVSVGVHCDRGQVLRGAYGWYSSLPCVGNHATLSYHGGAYGSYTVHYSSVLDYTTHPFARLTVIYTVLSCIIVSDFMLPVMIAWVSQLY
jgi:hypothetical protein